MDDEELSGYVFYSVGDGRKTRFWHDKFSECICCLLGIGRG